MMVSDDGINTPASFDTPPSKSVRKTTTTTTQPSSLSPAFVFRDRTDRSPLLMHTPYEREGPHIQSASSSSRGPLTKGRKDIKKKKKKKRKRNLRVKRERHHSHAPGHARVRDGLSERRNRRLRSGVSRNGKHRLLSRVCVFVTFCCCSSKGARFS